MSLQSLPPELRLRIFSLALSLVDIHAIPGPPMTSPKPVPGLGDQCDPSPVEDNGWQNMNPPTPIYRLDISLPLLLVSKQVRNEVCNLPWESHVRFVFPSTVSMIDTLVEWPRNRIERIRKMKLLGTPLPLYPIDNGSCYHTHSAGSALALLKGLQMDVLEYEDAYLPEDDGWGRDFILYEMTNLMQSLGWRELRYLAKQPYLREDEITRLVQKATFVREDREEPEYDFDLPTTPVVRDKDGRIERLNQAEDPGWAGKYDTTHLQSTDFQIDSVMTVSRGKGAEYMQNDYGSDVTDVLKALLARMTWRQLRESGDYLVNDGTQDPCAHL